MFACLLTFLIQFLLLLQTLYDNAYYSTTITRRHWTQFYTGNNDLDHHCRSQGHKKASISVVILFCMKAKLCML